MSNTPPQRTANMVHFPNKDETDPNALDEYLDALVAGTGSVQITGTPADDQVAVWTSATNIEGTSGLTYDGSALGVTGNITVSGTVDGKDVSALPDGSGAANQVTFWSDSDTITGDSGLTYDGSVLQVGSGDSGATIDSGADNFQIKTSATADIGMTISDGGTASRHTIEMRASDDAYGFWLTEHDATNTNDYGVRIGYNDATDEMSYEIDFDRGEGAHQFFSKTISPSGGASANRDADADDIEIFHGKSIGGMTFFAGTNGATQIGWGDLTDANHGYMVYSMSTGRLSFGLNALGSVARLQGANSGASLKLKEMSAAASDDSTFGQFWVRNDTPNTPMFTDDGGGDWRIVKSNRTALVEATDLGDDDNTYALVRLYGGGAGDNGAVLRLYNASDHDGTVEYWQLGPNNADANGGFMISAGNTTPRLTIDETSGDVTILQNLSVNGGIQGGTWTEHGDNPKATTSGTTANWTGIPSWVKQIVISFVGVSTNGTSPWIIQLGDSGGLETTGYTARVRGTGTSTNATTGFILTTANHAAADVAYGEVTLNRVNDGLGWTYSSNLVGNSRLFIGGGYKATSATMDRFTLTTVGGANTFDAGSVSARYS